MAYNAKHDSPMRALRRRVWRFFHPNRRLTPRERARLGNTKHAILLAVGGAFTR